MIFSSPANFSMHSSSGHFACSLRENWRLHLLLLPCFLGIGTERSRKGSKQKDLRKVKIHINKKNINRIWYYINVKNNVCMNIMTEFTCFCTSGTQ